MLPDNHSQDNHTSYLCVRIADVLLNYISWKPGNDTHHIGTFYLHVLTSCADRDYPYLMLCGRKYHRYISHPGVRTHDVL